MNRDWEMYAAFWQNAPLSFGDWVVLIGFTVGTIAIAAVLARVCVCPLPAIIVGEVSSLGKRTNVTPLVNLFDLDFDTVIGGGKYGGATIRTDGGEVKFRKLRLGKDLDASLGERFRPGFRGTFFATKDRLYAVHDGERLHYFRTDITRRWDLPAMVVYCLAMIALAVWLGGMLPDPLYFFLYKIGSLAVSCFALYAAAILIAYVVRRLHSWRRVERAIAERYPEASGAGKGAGA